MNFPNLLAALLATAVCADGGETLAERGRQSWVTGDLGVDFTNHYIYYGIPQENQGVIVQPYADLSFKLYTGSGALNELRLSLGTWSSVHGHHPGVTANTPGWYEFDLTGGLAAQFGKVTATVTWLDYSSPSDSYERGDNLSLRLDFDDSAWLGTWALHPHAIAMRELEGKSGSGPDQGIYWEFGVAPGFDAGFAAINFPLTVALGSGGFYGSASGEDVFGFFSAGLAAEIPLGVVPEQLGTWALKANATYYHLGRNAALAGESVTGGAEDLWVFGGGIVVEF